MPASILNYGRPPSLRVARLVVISVVSGIAALLTWYAGHGAWIEYQLWREAAMLLSTNVPAQMWQASTDITLNPDSTLMLPDGRLGRLVEMVPRRSGRPSHLLEPDAALDVALDRLRAEQVGCSVVGAGKDGLPLVQIWARSPRACYGMCGNSSRTERRRGAMRLWRNVGVHMAQKGDVDCTDQAIDSPVSVIGF